MFCFCAMPNDLTDILTSSCIVPLDLQVMAIEMLGPESL